MRAQQELGGIDLTGSDPNEVSASRKDCSQLAHFCRRHPDNFLPLVSAQSIADLESVATVAFLAPTAGFGSDSEVMRDRSDLGEVPNRRTVPSTTVRSSGASDERTVFIATGEMLELDAEDSEETNF